MNLIGIYVKHKDFGEGIIKQQDGNYLVVSFSQGDKRFIYPDAFDNFITVSDNKIAEFISLELENKKCEKSKMEKQKNQQNGNIVSKTVFTNEFSASWDNIFNLNSILEDFFPKRETLLTIKRNHEGKIKEIVAQRKIEYLVHFTRIDNLSSILKSGLIPVSLQHEMKIPSVHNDEQRIDSKLDCTSCSVAFPN